MSSRLMTLIGRHVTVRLTTIAGLIGMQVMLTIAGALALQQNQALRSEASMYQKLAAPPVDRNVPPIGGIDWTGARRQIAYGEEQLPTLIYAFSKDWAPCISNWAAMRTIQKLSPHRLRIVYVDTVDALTDEYLRAHDMTSDVVFSRLDASSALHYRPRATPQSQLIDASGRVVWSKLGKFGSDDVAGLLAIIEKYPPQSAAMKGVQQ